MTLTTELEKATLSHSVSCNSMEKDLSQTTESNKDFPDSTYLCSASEDDPILDKQLNDEEFTKIEFEEDEVFNTETTSDLTDCPVISFSGSSVPGDEEEKIGKDLVSLTKLKKSSSSDDVNSGATKVLTRRDYLMILVTFFIALIAKGNSAGLSVLAVEWLQEFENSKALILYVPALNFAITSAAGIIDGYLISKFGISRVILSGCILQVSCMIGSCFSTNAITLVMVLGFLAGLGNCFLFVNAFIFVGVHFGEGAKPIIAVLSVAGPIGGLIFPNLIALFIEIYGWRGCVLILAGINLQVMPLGIFLAFAQKDPENVPAVSEAGGNKRTPGSPKKLLDLSILKNFLFVMYVSSVSLTVGGINSVFSMLPDFLCEKGLGLKEAAKIYAIYYTLSAVPRILIGIAMKYTKVNFIHIYITMASLFGLTMALMNLAESYLMLLVCCILWALWMGCPAGLYSIGIMELVGPEKHSSGQSIVESSYGLTTAFFGFLAGLLVEYTDSYRQPFYIYGTAIVVINICLLITTSAQQLKLKLGFSRLASK